MFAKSRQPEVASELGRRLATGDRSAAPAALNILESRIASTDGSFAALLAEVSPAGLGREAPGQIVGVTGPPGAGKSTLLSQLVAFWRAAGKTVAVLAIDPSSKRSGGALLGDRARIQFNPSDDGVLIRSTATATHLGGLAPSTRESALALATAFDIVVIETVGVGQSETAVADTSDTVVVVVQPASGDVLQFLKSGVMEVPDVLVVTKADLGAVALRAQRDLHASLRSLGAKTPVVAVSAIAPVRGIDQLVDAIEQHHSSIDLHARRTRTRRMAAVASFEAEHGDRGLRALGGRRAALKSLDSEDAGLDSQQLAGKLEKQLGG